MAATRNASHCIYCAWTTVQRLLQTGLQQMDSYILWLPGIVFEFIPHFILSTHTHNHFMALWTQSGTTRVNQYQKKHSPNHCLLFAAYAYTIATCFAVVLNPGVSLSILYLEIYPSNHSHLYPLKCRLISLFYRPGLTFMQHTTLHTTATQSPSHYQQHILIGKQRHQLPKFIPSNSNSGPHSRIINPTPNTSPK